HEFAEIGGLIVYGVDLADVFRHMADQADQILKGAKPGDIPFYQPTKFHLVINVKTAKMLGITVPPTLLIAPAEVVEYAADVGYWHGSEVPVGAADVPSWAQTGLVAR